MKIEYVESGKWLLTKQFRIFLGNSKSCTLSKESDICFLQQIHGNKIVERNTAKGSAIRADGQWTNRNNLKLAIRTADCVPVFGFDKQSKKISALHVGWRGIAENILTNLDNLGKNTAFVIGPHIGFDSFYLNESNVNGLLNSIGSNFTHARKRELISPSLLRPRQWSVNLQATILYILKLRGVTDITTINEDTFWSEKYFSNRRLKINKKRNISFIEKI